MATSPQQIPCDPQQISCLDYCCPTRNRYFYGKLLDVFHFELEQKYFNSKRWLLNRLVTGYGVICGLNVLLTADKKSIYVTPGVAIDKCGHEIIVCQDSNPVALPPLPVAPPVQAPAPGGTRPPMAGVGGAAPTAPAGPAAISGGGAGANAPTAGGMDGCSQYINVVLCYHECLTDPVPSMGGDCDTQAMCSPGAIRERYCIQLAENKLAPARMTSAIADLFIGGTINYPALANYVTDLSPDDPCPDCCIPLANIGIPDTAQSYDQTNIDITVRPIVYHLDLLYEMILAMRQGPTSSAAIRKP